MFLLCNLFFFFFSSRRRHTRFDCDWSSDVCSSDLKALSRDAGKRRIPCPKAPDATAPWCGHWPIDMTLARSVRDRKSTRLNSSHSQISYAVFCLKKKKKNASPSLEALHVTRRSHT